MAKEEITLEIRIWSRDHERLPDDRAAALRRHVEHVATMLSEGCVAGEIFEEGDERGLGAFKGWWEIKGPS